MRYSIEPRDIRKIYVNIRIYVKGYGFLFFAKNMGKSLSNKYGEKLLNNNEDLEITAQKKRQVSPEERQQIIDELRLIPKKDAYFQKLLMN